MEKCLFYMGCVMIVCAVAAAIALRMYLVAYTGRLVATLDAMIAGRESIEAGEDEELLMAKVEVKLRQLYEISGEQKEKSRRDRERLESTISDISHQVKTPVSNMRMYHSLLKSDDISPRKRSEFMDILEEQVNRLDFLMQSMIKMSRLEVGMIQVKPVFQPICRLIEEAVCQAAPGAQKKQIDIQVDCDSYIQAAFDKKWTAEALGNILDNGIKYTEPCGKIGIWAEVTDFFVKISVSDTGKGIPEDHYTEIFKRFYREEDVQQEEGLGIGLFLAQEIIRRQKGYIDVKSQAGRGSVFSIYLPAEA